LVARQPNRRHAKLAVIGKIQGATIHDFATVSVGAILLPGVNIGSVATVGANAAGTPDVAAGVTVMGVLARGSRESDESR